MNVKLDKEILLWKFDESWKVKSYRFKHQVLSDIILMPAGWYVHYVQTVQARLRIRMLVMYLSDVKNIST